MHDNFFNLPSEFNPYLLVFDAIYRSGGFICGFTILYGNLNNFTGVANFLVIFIGAFHDGARAFTRKRMKTNTNVLRSI